MNLLLLNTYDQYEFYKSSIYFDDKTFVPLTYDIGIIWALEQEKINHINFWDFITPSDLHRNSTLAYDISRNWWIYFNINIDPQIVEFLEASQQEFIYPFEAALNASTFFYCLIEKLKFNEIIFLNLERIPIIRAGPSPVMNLLASVGQSVFIYICNNRNISYNIIDNWKNKKFKTSSNSSFLKFLKQLKNISFTRSITLSKDYLKGIYLINGSSKVEYEEIYKRNEKIKEERDLLMLDENYLDDIFICDLDYILITSKLDYFKSIINLSNSVFSFPEIFNNEFFYYQFYGVLEEIKRSIRISKSIVHVLKTYDLGFVLLGVDTFTNGRMISAFCKDIDIPCFTLFHTGLGLNSSSKWILGNSEHVLTWNVFDEVKLGLFGISKTRFSRIGSIRYQNLDLDSVSNNFKFEGSNVLILTSAIHTDLAAPNADAKKHLFAWKSLLNYINQKKNLNFIIRSHPSYDNFSIYDYIKSLNVYNLFFDKGSRLQETLSSVGVCVMFNCLTTAAIDAMILQKPVIFFNNAILNFSEFGDVYPLNFSLRIYDYDSLEIELEKILTDLDYRNQLVNHQNLFLQEYFELNKSSAIDNLWSKLDDVCQKALVSRIITSKSERSNVDIHNINKKNYNFSFKSSPLKRKIHLKTILIFNKNDSIYNFFKLIIHSIVFRNISKEEFLLFIKYILQTRLRLKLKK